MGLTGQTDRITPTTSSLSLSSYTSLFLFFLLTSSLCLYPLYGYDWPYMSTDNGWSLTKFSLLEWIILFFFGQEICYIRRLVVSFGSRGSTSLAVLVLFLFPSDVSLFFSPLPFIFTIFHDELHACVFSKICDIAPSGNSCWMESLVPVARRRLWATFGAYHYRVERVVQLLVATPPPFSFSYYLFSDG